jgi:D-serine deaminase-like pyridoxal phosphate-dependent protein
MRANDLETPVPVVDLDRLEANIARLQAYLDEHDLANRPHIKTHKIPAIAHMQLQAGAAGITCQKISEAEVMADAGLTDILIPYNIVGAAKLQRLTELARRATVSVTADSDVTARGLSDAARAAGLTLTVLVECDTGAQRCGVQSPDQAAALARLIAGLPGLRFGGLMTYPTSDVLDDFVRAVRALLREDRIQIPCVSGGGTACMWQAHTHPELTEHRAGMYVYGDRITLRSGAVTLETSALRVHTTVVSRPTPDRVILDAGSKSLSLEPHGLDGFGYICEYPEARLYALSEEHGHADFSACARRPEIGERLTVIPNHCCTVSNLFDAVVGARAGEVEVTWPVTARGTVR